MKPCKSIIYGVFYCPIRCFSAVFSRLLPLFTADNWRTDGEQTSKNGHLHTSKLSLSKEKKWYTLEWGKNPDQRKAAGIFAYVTCRNQIEQPQQRSACVARNKKSQLILEHQSIGTPYISTHRFHPNFFDYYAEFVKEHKIESNRRLECSLIQFRSFLGKEFLSPKEVTEKLCVRCQKYLLQKLTGETPVNYFAALKGL